MSPDPSTPLPNTQIPAAAPSVQTVVAKVESVAATTATGFAESLIAAEAQNFHAWLATQSVLVQRLFNIGQVIAGAIMAALVSKYTG
jgi:hypothetical protein